MDLVKLKKDYNKHKQEIKEKLREFSSLPKQNYIYELFFCLLTPQSKAEKCWDAVVKLKECELNKGNIEPCLKIRTRFYRNKTRYLLEANSQWKEIEKIISLNDKPSVIRTNLIKQVNGLGMKEASHFLRNIGKSDNQLAILDRHILRKLKELKIITKETNLNKKNYLLIEEKVNKFSKQVNIPMDDLDLLFWKIESGRIFK